MKKFSFELYAIGEFWGLTDSLTESILSAGHDGSPGTSEGVLEIAFDRESESLEDAVLSAIRDVETTAGIRIGRVSTEDSAAEATINGLLALRNSTTREHALEMWAKVG